VKFEDAFSDLGLDWAREVALQHAVSQWAERTFGPTSSNARVAARANEEMAELLRTLTTDDGATGKAIEEAADVVIILFRLADRMGYDLLGEVRSKMQVNAQRVWQRDGSGHGYHVSAK